MMKFKEIHVGELIKMRFNELNFDFDRFANYLGLSDDEVNALYEKSHVDTELLLKCSKILNYDFFRVYSQHLILYSPASTYSGPTNNSELPQFRKNIYTKEVIDFILESLNSGEKSKQQIIEEYRIPKTTLYKWIKKHN